MSGTRRLGIVVTHPIQYQVPLYRYLAANTTVDPYVFFLTDHGVASSYDPGFERQVHYDVPLLDGYEHEFVRNWSPWPSPSSPWGAVDPGLPWAIRRSSIDALMVHGWSNASAWMAFATAKFLGIPYLLRGEARPDAGNRPRGKRLVKHTILSPLVRHAGACLAIGSGNRAFYLDYGASRDRIFDTPYSVDTERFKEAGDRGRGLRQIRIQSLGLAPDRPVVLCAAKLQPWKRPLDVVHALDLLDGAANLVVIGDGPLRPQLDEAAISRPWMRVLGFVNQTEIAEWYGVADLFVLASDHEPWGLAVNEAMAAGALPIVSDAVGCGPDLVTPDIGWIYEMGDIRALAGAIDSGVRLFGSLERRAAARARSEQWGIASTARGVEQALEAVTP